MVWPTLGSRTAKEQNRTSAVVKITTKQFLLTAIPTILAY